MATGMVRARIRRRDSLVTSRSRQLGVTFALDANPVLHAVGGLRERADLHARLVAALPVQHPLWSATASRIGCIFGSCGSLRLVVAGRAASEVGPCDRGHRHRNRELCQRVAVSAKFLSGSVGELE